MVSPGLFLLLDLQSKLAYLKYDTLGLNTLNDLRHEVNTRIEDLCSKSRETHETNTKT